MWVGLGQCSQILTYLGHVMAHVERNVIIVQPYCTLTADYFSRVQFQHFHKQFTTYMWIYVNKLEISSNHHSAPNVLSLDSNHEFSLMIFLQSSQQMD